YDNNGPSDTFMGGVTVATGAVRGQNHDEIITGPGVGSTNVRTFDVAENTDGIFTSTQLDSFFAYSAADGVRVGSQMLSGNTIPSILTASGPGNDNSNASFFATLQAPFDTSFTFNPSTGTYTAAPFGG